MVQIPGLSRFLPGELELNIPLFSLIAANVITIVLAIIQNWDVATVMFIYWAQSIIIGIFTIVSLLTAVASPVNTGRDDEPTQKPVSAFMSKRGFTLYKCGIAGFFALHYGIFHYAYYTFIVEDGLFGQINFSNADIYFACGLFFINHLCSFIYYRRKSGSSAASMGDDFFAPYSRIVPMHLTILFGGIITLVLQAFGIASTLPVLVIFLVFKTCVDLDMHMKKHNEVVVERLTDT